MGVIGRVVRAVASDITPLRESAPFRRLFAGQTVSSLGTQVTRVTVALQVYAITGSSLDVGLIGLASFLPLACGSSPSFGANSADASRRPELWN